MKKTEIILELDPHSLDHIQILAKEKGKTVNDEAAYLLERGIALMNEYEIRKNREEAEENEKPEA